MPRRKMEMEDLSPLGEYKEGMEWNPLEKVIFERRSIRAFKKEPLPDSMIRRILEAGRFAPSAGNQQPWKFAVVKNPEILAEMEADAIKMAKIMMFFLDSSRSEFRRKYTSWYTRLMIRIKPNELHPVPFSLLKLIADGKTGVFHGAPTLILLFQDKRGVSCPPLDMGVCGEHMVLTAHSMGAGACWIGLVKLLFYYPKWRKFFDLKWPYECNECIALGWPKGDYDGEVKREMQLVTWYEGGMDEPPRVERQGG
ncbi:nitroreductase [Desulfatibacillum aliphaticivorans]|uniref:Nitroreductase n=1 Tax=Desulfatibacillum aliphaticivorans TaxID=218208 RepID=B8FC98_DESAL|nr:nitroreductase family protein [Desulfatibacillum aliphaticivorans]ACL05516.1 nitroreductase [Desulfatibacillum aliphaticivorans]